MKMLKVVPLIFWLIYTATRVTGWPEHTICKNNQLEIKYRSCDPLQDFAFSFDSCSSVVAQTVNIRIATILRYSITELTVDVSLTINGRRVPIYSKKLCERDHPRLSFCGKKRGEHIYYEGPISAGFSDLPQGNFNLTVQLLNEDRHTIICADFTVKNQ
ncbi:lymphocyte antigen 86 [Elgaria multicarinata webbii]|uniref:lymphocyte antigen 86 n=1 Tax=Elgaria multicarinata webbii TaxID=159646 RepID=UPI002FCCF5C6